MQPVPPNRRRSLPPGTEVAVRTHYQEHWAAGFDVCEGDDNRGYVLLRRSDGVTLPARFFLNELRHEQ